jgi:hypothetical protein
MGGAGTNRAGPWAASSNVYCLIYTSEHYVQHVYRNAKYVQNRLTSMLIVTPLAFFLDLCAISIIS